MTKTQQLAARELANLLECARLELFDGKLFSHLSRLPRGNKPGVYRLLAKKGLIERHPENDRYPLATVWRLTEAGLAVRNGEELSAVL